MEKEAGKPLMSGFHGFYSLGGMSGAILMTAILSSGVPVELASAAGAVMSVAFLLAGINGFRTGKSQEPAAFFALPKGVVVLIGIVCSIVFLAEGTFWKQYESILPRLLSEACKPENRSELVYAVSTH